MSSEKMQIQFSSPTTFQAASYSLAVVERTNVKRKDADSILVSDDYSSCILLTCSRGLSEIFGYPGTPGEGIKLGRNPRKNEHESFPPPSVSPISRNWLQMDDKIPPFFYLPQNKSYDGSECVGVLHTDVKVASTFILHACACNFGE
jgi:hypothetical protein